MCAQVLTAAIIVCLVTFGIVFWFYRQAPDEVVRADLRKTLAALDLPPAATFKVFADHGVGSLTFGGRLTDGRGYTGFAVRSSGVVTFLRDNGAESGTAEPGDPTGPPALGSLAEASAKALRTVRRLDLGVDLRLGEASYLPTESGRRGGPGATAFRFWGYFDGYRFLDRECGVHLVLDMSSGRVLSYSNNLHRHDAPSPVDPPLHRLTAGAAWMRFNPDHPMPPHPVLGWAQPDGHPRAKLCYMYVAPPKGDDPVVYDPVYLDAQTGQFVKVH